MTLPPLTYSQLEKFANCPKQFYHVKVARDFVERENEASIWGDRVHKAIEARMDTGVEMPDGMKQWTAIVDKVARLPGQRHAEFKLSIDKNFQPTDWSGSWCRGIADVLVVDKEKALILDWKTGKRKPSDQLKLYAAMTFSNYPQVKTVFTRFVWLRDRTQTRDQMDRSEVPVFWQQFLPAVRKIEHAYETDKWPARPSWLCNGWCPVTTCVHWKEKK